MTAFNKASKSSALVGTVEQSETAPVLAPRNIQHSTLPNPKGASAKVADSGRIRFGNACRLPTPR